MSRAKRKRILIGESLEVEKRRKYWQVVIWPVDVVLTGAFMLKDQAVDAATEADQICDWLALARSALDGKMEERREQYRATWSAILKKHGGFMREGNDKGPLVTNEMMASRIVDMGVA